MQNNFILRFYIIFQVHEYAGRLRSMCISQVINQAQKTFVSFKDSHFLCLHCGDMTAFGSRCRSTFKEKIYFLSLNALILSKWLYLLFTADQNQSAESNKLAN